MGRSVQNDKEQQEIDLFGCCQMNTAVVLVNTKAEGKADKTFKVILIAVFSPLVLLSILFRSFILLSPMSLVPTFPNSIVFNRCHPGCLAFLL